MQDLPIVALMTRESTRRKLTEPAREPLPHAPRRTIARVLLAAAKKLDPAVAGRTSTAAG